MREGQSIRYRGMCLVCSYFVLERDKLKKMFYNEVIRTNSFEKQP